MMIDCEQGSDLWASARCGLVTASRCADVLATVKKGESASRRNYRAELIVEILTGLPVDHFVSREMEWGGEQEPFGRAAYEMECDVLVETCGFVLHPTVPRFGASPDGLVAADGMVQIKCPNTATHLEWLLSGSIPMEHAPQMLAEMACTGRQWSDFVSFDPRLPKHLQLFIRRFKRDDALIAALEAQVEKFNGEIDKTLAQLPQSAEPQPIVDLLDDMVEPEDTSPLPASQPAIPSEAKPKPTPKPKIDDVDSETGKPKFVNYAQYEAAKDNWLQQDTLRLLLEMIYRGK